MKIILFLALITLAGLLFLPGASGPFVFDDRTNISENALIQIDILSLENLRDAAFSTTAGPLGRPIANLSMALNHYFSGQIIDTTPYKLTNIAIHIVNGYLVFWLTFLLLQLIQGKNSNRHPGKQGYTLIIAGLIAVAWTAHPITLTSVLYTVQRMTSLAALFSLASIIAYLYGRKYSGDNLYRRIPPYTITVGFWILAIFTKENALLVPLFILLIELTCFTNRAPWNRWQELRQNQKVFLFGITALGAFLLLYYTIQYASSSYLTKDFTMEERLLTQGRVIWFYLSLIVLPNINNFGLFHDDIPLSTSLLEPITTLPALAGIVLLLYAAFVLRRHNPLFTLGIYLYFSGHLLESSVFALEMIHEHRNYLPSLGILLAVSSLLKYLSRNWQLLASFLFIGVFSVTSVLRADQWASYHSLAFYNAKHHPNSSKAQSMMTVSMLQQGNLQQAHFSASRAADLSNRHPARLMMKFFTGALIGLPPDKNEQSQILHSLANEPINATTQNALLSFANFDCYKSNCSILIHFVGEWIKTAIDATQEPIVRSYYFYLQGQFLYHVDDYPGALQSFYRSYQDDNKYLQPLFKIASMYIDASQFKNAEDTITLIEKAARKSPHPRKKEIEEIKQNLNKAKQQNLRTP